MSRKPHHSANMGLPLTLAIAHRTDALVAGSVVLRWAAHNGLPRKGAMELAIVVSELATNVVKHAGGSGVIHLWYSEDMVHVHTLDRGPGMEEPTSMLMDRAPRTATPSAWKAGLGCGGGAIRRLMDEVTVRNREGGGLEVYARKRQNLDSGGQG